MSVASSGSEQSVTVAGVPSGATVTLRIQGVSGSEIVFVRDRTLCTDDPANFRDIVCTYTANDDATTIPFLTVGTGSIRLTLEYGRDPLETVVGL